MVAWDPNSVSDLLASNQPEQGSRQRHKPVFGNVRLWQVTELILWEGVNLCVCVFLVLKPWQVKILRFSDCLLVRKKAQ